MPVVCTPDGLSENVTCLANQDQQTLLAQIVYLLCRISNMADCSPDSLAENANVRCLQNWNQQDLLAATVFLLCQIESGGGGGVTDYNLDGTVDPNGSSVDPPIDPTKTWTYTNTAAFPNPTFWVWPANGSTWAQVV